MRRPLLAVLAVGALAAGTTLGPQASAAPTYDPLAYGFQGEGGLAAKDRDSRTGTVAPTAEQRAAVAALGARAEWGPLGSPQVLTRDDAGYLSGPATGDRVDIARDFVRKNRAVFGLSEAQVGVDALAVLKAVPLTEGPMARAQMRREPVSAEGSPFVVTFQQVFDGAPAFVDGLLTVGLDPDGRVAFVSSTVTRDTEVTNTVKLSALEAVTKAAKDAGETAAGGDLKATGKRNNLGAEVIRRAGVADDQSARLTAIPTPKDGVRLAWRTFVLQSVASGPRPEDNPYAYASMVDAETGAVLHRINKLEHLADTGAPGAPAVITEAPAAAPYWRVFPANPAFPIAGTKTPDSRVYWCFAMQTGCAETLGTKGGKPNTASPYAYDENVADNGTRTPTFATDGNNARTAISRVSQLTPDTAIPTVSATRKYDFPFNDQWNTSNCNPANFVSPGLNDADAATANLNVMHNRMHDWGYYLGWTEQNSNFQKENAGAEGADSEARENDPEIGNSQSGSVSGGAAFTGRDNANQITLDDGTPGITNQYLWEPLQAGFYAPCVDGAYDMSVVGHEVGHGIQGRMTAGSAGLSGMQARSMGESWADLTAVEYLNGYGYLPVADENLFAVGPYVTGAKLTGIRNYNMSQSPLNYSNLEYDGNGTASPHADGEIWSATHFDIRKAMIAKYDAAFPSTDKALQFACADGLKPSTACPGNRRWIQLIHDGFLLQPSATSMLTSRDAILAADKMRYAGANLELLWEHFAKRAMGDDAESPGPNDLTPTPGFRSPLSKETGRVTLAVSGGKPEETKIYIGTYEARISPVAVLENGASKTVSFEPGTYQVLAVAKGFGHRRTTMTVTPGAQTVTIPLRRNLASVAAGGKASGDGTDGGQLNLDFINDDTEGTNWASVRDGSVKGKQVTVELAGGPATVSEVQVSAANRPRLCEAGGSTTEPTDVANCEESREAPYDTGGQSRFAALRSFEILTCDSTTGKACTDEADFTSALVATDAFPAARPRPTVRDLHLRTFALPNDVKASHVRIKVLDNQCTGGPMYTGAANPESNPLSNPDCVAGMTFAAATGPTQKEPVSISLSQADIVRISELQVFGSRTIAAPPAAAPPAAAPPVQAPPVAAPPSTLPTTGLPPVALPALVLLLLAGAAHRIRRTTA